LSHALGAYSWLQPADRRDIIVLYVTDHAASSHRAA